MMMVEVKSTVRPSALVSRPSPSTPSSASNTAGCAFSISSSSTTEKGWPSTRRVSSPLGVWRSPIKRATEPRSWNSLMSKRTRRSPLPNSSSASALAVSVLPTPVGPTNKNVASGRPGSLSPCSSKVTTSTAASTAAGWATIRRVKCSTSAC